MMNKLRKNLLLICCATTALVPQFSSAAISLTVDPSTQTLSFIGSDTGTSMDLFGSVQIASWDFGSGSGPNEFVTIAAAFDETFTNRADLIVIDGNLDDGLRIVLVNNGGVANSFNTVTTNSTVIDYSGLAPTYIAILESFGTDTFTLNQGTGFSSIALDTIPEPGSNALICFALALAVCRRRR